MANLRVIARGLSSQMPTGRAGQPGPPGPPEPPKAKPVETIFLTRANVNSVMGSPVPFLLVATNGTSGGTDANIVETKSMRFLEAAKGQIPMVKLDTQTFAEAAQSLQIHSVPAVYLISQGRVVDRVGGSGEHVTASILTEYFERLAKMINIQLPSPTAEMLSDAAHALDVERDVDGAADLFQAVVNNADASKEHLMSAAAGLCRVALDRSDMATANQLLNDMEVTYPGNSSTDVRHARALVDLHRRHANPQDDDEHIRAVVEMVVTKKYAEAINSALKLMRGSKTPETKSFVLQVIDAAGPATAESRKGRRRFSSALFL